MLSQYGANPTPVEFIAKRLSSHYKVLAKSSNKQKAARLWDAVAGLINNRNQIELVIIDVYAYQSFWYSFIIGMLARSLGKPYILYLHSDQLKVKYRSKPQSFQRLLNHSQAIVTPSDYLKSFFEAKGYACLEIPNLINVIDYKGKIRESIKPNLVWIRAFHKNYQPSVAIEVMNLLVKQIPEATLTMIGPVKDDTYEEVVQSIRQYGLESRVSLMDKQDKATFIEICRDKDIFLNTSEVDNQPITLIEAMAMGLPIVSTNAGGIPYLIEDGQEGILVEKANAQKMADQVVNLIANPGQCRMISQNAVNKAKNFDWAYGKQQWLELIEKVRKAD